MARPQSGTNIERFWRKTRVVGSCIEISGWKDKDGYGRFAVRLDTFKLSRPTSREFRTVVAHRWIYAQVIADAGGQVVMHSCDNPACVALQHLSVGTQALNQTDSVQKGRHIGVREDRGRKLTKKLALEIRASTERTGVLARRYGVDRTLIQRIRQGKAWR